MDVLSEVLRVVRLQGALFFNVEFTTPWSVRAASSQALAQHFAPSGDHVITYHLLTEGRACVWLDSGEELLLGAGDLVMIPHG
jgi:quercetin dioxygenase-like cupin family protein